MAQKTKVLNINLFPDTSLFKSYGIYFATPTKFDIWRYKIPSGITQYRILEVIIQKGQYYKNHETEINNSNDSILLNKFLYFQKTNKENYSEKKLDGTIKILSFTDSSGRKSLILDTNNNYDFTDQEVICNETLANQNSLPLYARRFYTISNLSFYNTITGVDYQSSVKISPDIFSSSLKGLTDTLAYVEITFLSNAKSGIINIGDKPNFFTLISNDPLDLFDSAHTYIQIDENISSAHNVRPGELFFVGEIVSIQSKYYKIESVDSRGKAMAIRPLSNKPILGYRKGFFAPSFHFLNLIDNASIDSKSYEDEFVLLDFWGTWCQPCLKTIPLIKSNLDYFKSKKVSVISVTWDTSLEHVKSFCETNSISWPTAFEDMRKPKNSEIVLKDFNVKDFPTFILIGKKSRILIRDIGEEGLQRIINYIKLL